MVEDYIFLFAFVQRLLSLWSPSLLAPYYSPPPTPAPAKGWHLRDQQKKYLAGVLRLLRRAQPLVRSCRLAQSNFYFNKLKDTCFGTLITCVNPFLCYIMWSDSGSEVYSVLQSCPHFEGRDDRLCIRIPLQNSVYHTEITWKFEFFLLCLFVLGTGDQT